MVADSHLTPVGGGDTHSRRRLIIFKATAILIGCVVALAVTEAGLRLIEGTSIAARTQTTLADPLPSAYSLTGLDLDDPRVAEGLRITKLVLARIQQQNQGRVKLIVLMIPTKELVYADVMRAKGHLNENYARVVEMESKARNELLSWCSDNEIKSIDALAGMQAAIARREQIYPATTESHPNAAGYAVIASVVNDSLKSAPN